MISKTLGLAVGALCAGMGLAGADVVTQPRRLFGLTWSTGALQQADSPMGPWATVPNAASPLTVRKDAPSRFYRVETQLDD